MDTILPKCRCLHVRSELITRLKKAIAAPEDAKTFLLEVLKFILTVAMIMVTGVVLLMVG